MNLLFCSAASNGAQWRAALACAFPTARVHVCSHSPDEGVAPPQGIDYALLWKPPSELLAKLKSAKAIFNLGAGVDALLALRPFHAHALLELRALHALLLLATIFTTLVVGANNALPSGSAMIRTPASSSRSQRASASGPASVRGPVARVELR